MHSAGNPSLCTSCLRAEMHPGAKWLFFSQTGLSSQSGCASHKARWRCTTGDEPGTAVSLEVCSSSWEKQLGQRPQTSRENRSLKVLKSPLPCGITVALLFLKSEFFLHRGTYFPKTPRRGRTNRSGSPLSCEIGHSIR